MRAELIQKWLRDTLISGVGIGGLVNEVFIQDELNWATASFCMVILLVPGAFALASLKQNSGESSGEPDAGTPAPGSPSPPPPQPSSPSSSSSSA